ncbi:regulator, partial [Streptomyces canus]
MITPSAPSTLRVVPAEHRERLMRVAREVSFPQGTRLFEEGSRAD